MVDVVPPLSAHVCRSCKPERWLFSDRPAFRQCPLNSFRGRRAKTKGPLWPIPFVVVLTAEIPETSTMEGIFVISCDLWSWPCYFKSVSLPLTWLTGLWSEARVLYRFNWLRFDRGFSFCAKATENGPWIKKLLPFSELHRPTLPKHTRIH